jgi:hypothetical protein
MEATANSQPPHGAVYIMRGLRRLVIDVSDDRTGRIGVTYENQEGARRYCSLACFREWIKRAQRIK